MFNALFHLKSGGVVSTRLEEPEVKQLVANLLATPDLVPGLLESRPTEAEASSRDAQLQLIAVSLGESLRRDGTLNFLGENARSVVIRTDEIAAFEITDPDAPPARNVRTRILARPNVPALAR